MHQSYAIRHMRYQSHWVAKSLLQWRRGSPKSYEGGRGTFTSVAELEAWDRINAGARAQSDFWLQKLVARANEKPLNRHR
jgi:hypothetical protein